MDDLKKQFGRIYDQYIDRIYRFVYLKVNSREIAEDITSNVFLKAWENYKENKGKIKNTAGFLYQIARNSVIDYYRKEERTKRVLFQEIENLSHQNTIPDLESGVVRQALSKLSPVYQDVIILYYLEEMPVKEIAELTGLTPTNIRVMIHRGIKELKKIIEEI